LNSQEISHVGLESLNFNIIEQEWKPMDETVVVAFEGPMQPHTGFDGRLILDWFDVELIG
jgi:hypothetical protein